MKALWGPKLGSDEVNRAKDRAPLDRNGNLLCWGNLCHVGCGVSNCQRSHESLRGSFESLDPCVQMQFLKRGGLKRMRMETKDSVVLKIKEIRAKLDKDKKEKIQDGNGRRQVARAGQEEQTNEDRNKEANQRQEDVKAGATQRQVRFWEPPEEFQVDYTAEEDVRQLVMGPQKDWGEPAYVPVKDHGGRNGESAPVQAHQLVREAQKLGGCEALQKLEGASDDLYAWAAARLAREPGLDFASLMTGMATYGLGDLASEAADLLEQGGDGKAGSSRLQVHSTQWGGDGPGRGMMEVDGLQWQMMDYKEEVYMTDELAGLLKLSEPVKERRQCVTLSLAAACFRRRHGRWPSMGEAQQQAQVFRLEQTRLAVEAMALIGEADEVVAAVEHEARIYVHDLVTAHHEKDFRSLALFPLQELQEAKVVVLRADYKGGMVVESVVGTHWSPGGWILPVLI